MKARDDVLAKSLDGQIITRTMFQLIRRDVLDIAPLLSLGYFKQLRS